LTVPARLTVTFPVTAEKLALAIALTANGNIANVEAITRSLALHALKQYFYYYGEGMCWTDDYPADFYRRALEIVRERGWAS
jgi:hypothetical protein